MRLCRENADSNNWGVVSFWPHPAEYMHKFSHTLFTNGMSILLLNALAIHRGQALMKGEEFIGFGKYAGYDYVKPEVIVPKR